MNSKRSFSDLVYELTSQVPRGRVTTYGAIAKKLDRPKATRAVGRILGANPQPIIVPCHRVVKADGSLGGYTAPKGVRMKIELLTKEGVVIEDGKIDLSRFVFKDFRL